MYATFTLAAARSGGAFLQAPQAALQRSTHFPHWVTGQSRGTFPFILFCTSDSSMACGRHRMRKKPHNSHSPHLCTTLRLWDGDVHFHVLARCTRQVRQGLRQGYLGRAGVEPGSLSKSQDSLHCFQAQGAETEGFPTSERLRASAALPFGRCKIPMIPQRFLILRLSLPTKSSASITSRPRSPAISAKTVLPSCACAPLHSQGLNLPLSCLLSAVSKASVKFLLGAWSLGRPQVLIPRGLDEFPVDVRKSICRATTEPQKLINCSSSHEAGVSGASAASLDKYSEKLPEAWKGRDPLLEDRFCSTCWQGNVQRHAACNSRFVVMLLSLTLYELQRQLGHVSGRLMDLEVGTGSHPDIPDSRRLLQEFLDVRSFAGESFQNVQHLLDVAAGHVLTLLHSAPCLIAGSSCHGQLNLKSFNGSKRGKEQLGHHVSGSLHCGRRRWWHP